MSDEDVAMLRRLAHFVAAENRGYCHGRSDREDLVSVAMLAGVKASKTWNPQGGRPLGAWMLAKMRRDVYHHVRDGGLGHRTVRTQHHGRETTRRVHVNPTDFQPSDTDETQPSLEPMVSYDLATYVTRRQFRDRLPERDQHIIRRLEQGATQSEIAGELGIGQAHVGRLAKRIATRYMALAA